MATIIVIDDQDLLRHALTSTLELEGHTVHAFESARHALPQVEAIAPDLLITDIIMPDKEGLEVILEVRRTHPQVRIMAMSGGGSFGTRSYLELAKRLGAHAVLSKPFTRDELVNALKIALGT